MADTICVGNNGNLEGSYKFFTLDTLDKITWHQFVVLPMPKATQHNHKIAQLKK
jgi:uncharacterized protein YqcC (DUF446 family)